jgi:8-oxo-dGTP pyrophosphatase MutT (NUDIX family)
METVDPPAAAGVASPRPASSVLLIRDGALGVEVFMATRHEASSFMPGVLVFPGGSVDPADGDPSLRGPGDGEDVAWRIAAIREAFEEAGFLLARAEGESEPVGPSRLEALLARWRGPLCAGAVTFAAMMAEAGLVPAPDLLIPFGHWITPRLRSKRFDTRFYLARAPVGQVGLHDDRELIQSRWVRPADALAEREAGTIRLVFATRANLGRLAESATVDEALARARGLTIVPVEPQPFEGPQGRMLGIPAAAGYALTEILAKDSGL